MPVRDIYHEVVKKALIKDGWTVTHGQYVSYQLLLEDQDPDRKLYLAVPSERQEWFSEKMLPKKAIQKLQILVFYYNDETQQIESWKP